CFVLLIRCPSCAGRQIAQMAAHLVEQVIPWVATRQWIVAVETLGEAGSDRALAACPPRPQRRLFGAPIANCGTQSSRHHANRVWTGRRRSLAHLLGVGPAF